VPAPIDGTILETFFDEGKTVPVYTTLFVIGERGEDADVFRSPSSALTATGSSAGATPPSASASPMVAHAQPPAVGVTSRASSHQAAPLADQHDLKSDADAGSGAEGKVLEENLRAEPDSPPRTPRKPIPA